MVLIFIVILITTKSLSFSFTNQALVEPIYLFTYFGNPPSPIRFKINTLLPFTHIGLSISFDLASLFVCDEFICESLYLSDNTNKENFEFGGAFIKMFNVSVFNYEDKTISYKQYDSY